MSESFRAAMRSHGIDCGEAIKADGKIHRFKPGGARSAVGWYVLHPDKVPHGAFGCWKRGIKEPFVDGQFNSLAERDRERLREKWAKDEAVRAKREKALAKRAQSIAGQLMNGAQQVTAHPYLKAKGIKAPKGIRLHPKDGTIMVPLSIGGVLTSLQFIGDDGQKIFLPKGQVKGASFTIHGNEGGPLIICEGVATGASIHEATDYTVVCAMNCGNIGPVAMALREQFPTREIVIAGDDDKESPHNAGRHAAERAARQCRGRAVFPVVGNGTDFNDLHAEGGLEEVRRQIVESKPSPWLSLLQDGADIITKELPPVVEIVEGLVSECSKFVIASGSKSFKTWITIAMALAIAHGIPFLSRRTTRRRVLYVNLELKPESFERRIQIISKATGISIEPNWFTHLPLRGKLAGLTVFEIVTRIISIARSIDAQVVILDPVYKANVEGEENNSRDQTLFFNQLDRITTEARCTVILNDHFGKGNQSDKDPLDAIRGSSAKGGDVDAAMILRRHEVEDCFRVDVIHRELPPVEPFSIGWSFPLMELRPDLDPEAMKKPAGGRARSFDPMELLAVIKDTSPENPVSISSWADKAKVSRGTLRGYTPSLRSKDFIGTAGEGSNARQFITPKGLSAVQEWEA